MNDPRDPNDEDAALALARTLAPGATALTYRPSEVRVRPQKSMPLPGASIAIASGAASEDTAMFLEQMARGRDADPPSEGPPEAYDIVGPLGRGGMGAVWRAVQRSLGREIALKQLTVESPVAEEHFLSEARVTARLSHANIIPVHGLGRATDGRPMLAMKLVHGRSWLDLLRDEGAGANLLRQLHIFLSVCNAVAFAHAEGFLHRDLKPANVMIGEFGQVFVVDWGLAVGLDRKLCEKNGILYVRDVKSPAGTPAYMAPELARGDGNAQGPHTDVYCLGAILHEIVTGSPPHASADSLSALRHALESPPPEYNESVPSELAAICRRAMAKMPEDRYPDVTSLRAAVEGFVAHDAARAVTEKGSSALRRLEEKIAERYAAKDPGEAERAIFRTYTEARFAFELALESWPDAHEARRGIAQADRSMLEYALVTEDLPLATRLAADVTDPDLLAKLAALRERLAAQGRELSALREQAMLLDDRRVARPLSNVFIVAGVLGGLAVIPTRIFLDGGPERAVRPITLLWGGMTSAVGLYAYFVLRGAKRSLVSPRVGWTWAAVGVACLSGGAVAIGQGEAPFQNASYTTMMIAIGFVAQALQTRLWLLYPAAITFAGAIAMGFVPTRRVEVFGLVWLLSITGVGIFLRRTPPKETSVLGKALPAEGDGSND